MNLDNDPRIERPGADPTASVTLNLQKCQRWIAAAQNYRRMPMGDFVVEVLGQLKCTVDELTTSGAKVDTANAQALRYQKEAETANAEVRAMQRLLGDEREKVKGLEAEIAALKAQAEKAAAAAQPAAKAPDAATTPPSTPPKRARRAKVVPIETPKAAAQ